LLLDKKADANYRTSPTSNNETALMYAAMNGHTEVVEALLKNDASSVNYRTAPNHETALMYAAMNGHLSVVKLLWAHKAKVNECTEPNEETPLMYAAMNGHLPVVEFLLSKGANIEAKTRNQKTALMYANIYSHKDVAEILAGKSLLATPQTALLKKDAVPAGSSMTRPSISSNKNAHFNSPSLDAINSQKMSANSGGISIVGNSGPSSKKPSSPETKPFGAYLTVTRETGSRETVYEFNFTNAWENLDCEQQKLLARVIARFENKNRGTMKISGNITKISFREKDAKEFLESLKRILSFDDTTLPEAKSIARLKH
jgi:ankyrin repeat protein